MFLIVLIKWGTICHYNQEKNILKQCHRTLRQDDANPMMSPEILNFLHYVHFHQWKNSKDPLIQLFFFTCEIVLGWVSVILPLGEMMHSLIKQANCLFHFNVLSLSIYVFLYIHISLAISLSISGGDVFPANMAAALFLCCGNIFLILPFSHMDYKWLFAYLIVNYYLFLWKLCCVAFRNV